ncbi:uncharacterized protein LOC132708052 isoform X2 [Cylas formicarius]|uniref:uncharacterized protein LOC132708052 isoform X2 n=1 Tax=Cylas formicarius TaxID=197179 RepID=UPI0029586693|nr:uncharacterized protein LOC132708052 isoform X2 [Cylas formicarius]
MCAYFSYCASLFVLVILHIPHAKRVWGQTEDSPTTLNSSSSSIPSPTPPSSIEILAIYVIPGIGNSIRVIWGADTDREMGNFTFGLFYGEDEGEFNYPKLTTSNLSVIVEDLEYCTRYSFAVTLDDGGGFDISKINPNLVRSIVTGIDPLAAPTNLTLSVFEKNMSRYKIITFPPNKRTDLIYKLGVSYGDEYEVRVSNNFPGAKAVGPMMYKVPAFLQPFKVKVAVNAEEGAFMIYWEEPFVPIRVGSYYYQFPSTEEDGQTIAQTYEQKWNFLHCLGAVDGKHINIIPPPNSGSFYWSYKARHSIVLMAIANTNCEFIMCDCDTNGRVSDGGVIENTLFYEKLISGTLKLPNPCKTNNSNETLPYVFIGDDAFSFRNIFLKPFSQKELNRERRIFNYSLSRARRVIENAFGIMVARFRIFHTAINFKIENIDKIVMTCCILHNILIRKRHENYAPSTCFYSEDQDSLKVV